MAGDAKALSYGDVYLRQSDVALLQPPRWLNDNLIAFYFAYLQREACSAGDALLLEPSVVFWLANCAGADDVSATLASLHAARCKALLLAVNDSTAAAQANAGSHWSLLLFLKSAAQFYHFDSAGSLNLEAATRLAEALAPHLPSTTAAVESLPCPQQINGYDCGVYVLAVAHSICSRLGGKAEVDGKRMASLIAKEVTPAAVAELRQSMKRLISTLALANARRSSCSTLPNA